MVDGVIRLAVVMALLVAETVRATSVIGALTIDVRGLILLLRAETEVTAAEAVPRATDGQIGRRVRATGSCTTSTRAQPERFRACAIFTAGLLRRGDLMDLPILGFELTHLTGIFVTVILVICLRRGIPYFRFWRVIVEVIDEVPHLKAQRTLFPARERCLDSTFF